MRTIRSGAHIAPCTILPSSFEIGFNSVILSNREGGQQTQIGEDVAIGSNCTIYPGLTIGSRALISSGSVVTSSVPPLAIVEGNPAIIKGYAGTSSSEQGLVSIKTPALAPKIPSSVADVVLYNLPHVPDMRGSLSVGEFSKTIPFECKRYFLVYDVPSAETRGEHAHKECHQFLIAVKGTLHVVADDGRQREEFVLDSPTVGLYLPPKTWGIQYKYTNDAVLLVFASDYYDKDDYIRDYDDFIAFKNKSN